MAEEKKGKEGTVEEKDGNVTIFAPAASAGAVDPFTIEKKPKK